VQEPTFSPGKKIACQRKICLYTITTTTSTPITRDKKNSISTVLRIGFMKKNLLVKAFDWSADSKKVAYIRFDESQVPEFSIHVW
jgi:dipeptidyl-peptidase-4